MSEFHFVATPWKVAQERGMVHYASPKACKRGHFSYRAVNRSDCWGCKEDIKIDKDRRIKVMLTAKRIKSRKYGVDFDLNRDNVIFPEYCPAIGILLDYSGEDREANATFDRLDPRKGYLSENVRVISGRANRIKSDADHEELRNILEYIEGELGSHRP